MEFTLPRAEGRSRALVTICAAILVLFALSGAGPQTQALPAHTKIRTVGIISAIGDTLMFERVSNSWYEWIGPPATSFLEITDWGLDDFVDREATAALSKHFAVKPVSYAEADFDTWSWSSLVRRLRELPLPVDDIDAYVVILRDWRGDEIGNSVHQIAGLGVYRRDYSRRPPRLGVFASYRIAIVDAHSYDILASREALMPDGHLPWAAVAQSLWPRTQNDLTDAQRTALQVDLNKLIDETLKSTLRQLALAE